MKLTIFNLKKWLVILAIILPLFLVQVAISSAVMDIFKSSLIESREENLNMLITNFRDSISEFQNLVTAINEIDNLNQSKEIIETSYSVDLLISSEPDNDLETQQKILNLLKSGSVVLDQTGTFLYFTDYNQDNKRIISIKKSVLELVDQTISIDPDKISTGIYFGDTLVYHTNRYIAFRDINNLNAELREAQGHTFLVTSQNIESIDAFLYINYDVTQELLVVKLKVIRYSLIMVILISLMGYIYYKRSQFSRDDIQILTGQALAIQKMLENKKQDTVDFESFDILFQENLEEEYSKSKKIIKSLTDLNNQIRMYKLEYEQLKMDQGILENTLVNLTLENDISKRIRDEFTNFVDQILIAVDHDLIIMDVNNVFIQKMGYRKEDIIGHPLSEFIVEDLDEELTQNIISLSDDLVFLNLLHKTQQETTSEFLSLKSIYWDQGHILLIGKSIHEEISLQSRILRKNRELEYINQINSSLISNWGIDELLENIIRRIDYLFSIEFGTIYVKNENDIWELKASSCNLTEDEDRYLSQIDRFINLDSEDIQTIDLNHFNSEHIPFGEDVKKLIVSSLVSEQGIVAVMIIGLKNNMKSGDLNILKMFKNQASIVIQRSILYDQLRKQYFSTIEALVNVIEAKDKYTEGHSRRVSRFSVEIAVEIGYSNEDIESIEISGLLHDVGKVGINQNILNKIGKLTDEEYEIVKEHPEKGIQILQSIKFDHKITEGIRYHHVRYDLQGYPENHGLKILPQYAAIIGVADAFDAMTSARSYTKPRSIKEAMKELDHCAGAQFDPEIVKAFHRVVDQKLDRIQIIIDDIRS